MGYICRKEKTRPNKLKIHVGCTPCSLQHYSQSQNVEATEIPIGSGMDKEDVVHMYIMEYYSAI